MRYFWQTAMAMLLTAPAALAQQAAPHAATGSGGGQNPFAVTSWFDIPSATNIAPGPDPHGKKVDLAVREDRATITVYGRKQKFEPRNWFRTDLDEPWISSAAPSVDMPVRQNSNCANAAYNTVGGQPATGRDLIGALGAGSGC